MATITEDYVSFEMAKLLKEKGFDELCYQKYDSDEELSFNHVGYINSEKPCDDFYALAPTLQMAMKWLREIYQIDIQVFRHIRGKRITFYARIEQNTHLEHQDKCNLYCSYEQACEVAIKYCLENLI